MVEGTIEAGFVVPGSVLSPSHSISVQTENARVRIALSDKSAVPDQIFVLRWQEQIAAAPTPRAWSQRKGNDQYALIEIRAPQIASESATTPQDVYFLVDRSGSMEGVKWRKAVEALQSCVKMMAPHDRIMLTLFENSFRDFSEAPMPPAQLLADEAFRQLESDPWHPETSSGFGHPLLWHRQRPQRCLASGTDPSTGRQFPFAASQ